MGVSGSGKSTIGKALAEHCSGIFYDADDFHPPENIAKMKRGEPLNDEDRAPWLKSLAQLLARATTGEDPVFLACSALKARYRETLRSGCADLRFVLLTGSPGVIRARMHARSGHFMPETLIDSQFATLEVTDDAVQVDIDSSVEDIVTQICSELGFTCDPDSAS